MRTSDGTFTGDWTSGALVLYLRECVACGRRWYLPRPCCPRCRAGDPRRLSAGGGGRLVAVSIVHRAPAGVLTPPIPFALALVDLDEGVRVMGHCAPGARPGDRVRLDFSGDPPRPYFHRPPCPRGSDGNDRGSDARGQAEPRRENPEYLEDT